MKKTCALVLILVLITVVCSACGGKTDALTQLDAAALTQKLADAGLPVENVIVYDENTDPNSLLGRPNSYTSKTAFADNRVRQSEMEDADPEGGTIEVFASVKDAKSRYDYISSFDGSVLGTYQYLHENVLMRITYQLTQTQADEYDQKLVEALK